MAKKEYIERDTVVKMFNKWADGYPYIEVPTKDAIAYIRAIPTADVRPVMQRKVIMQALNKYFSIGNSYTYELTRVKEAFYIGTMTLDDFQEWDEDNVSDLCDYLMKELFAPNCGANMQQEPT